MPTEPFPPAALDANRSGRLTPDQAALYRAEAATDRKNLLLAGVAVTGFGAVIVFGAVTGKIPGGRMEPLLVGAAIVAVGVAVAFFGGIRGSQAKAAAASAGRVTMLEGPIRRDRRDRRDGLGGDTGHYSPGNEYEYDLIVGDRSFTVSKPQWDAAPEDGVVRAYLLGDSSRIVNLERIADAPPPQVPGIVKFALDRAAHSPDPARAAQAQAMLQQVEAMTAAPAATPAPSSGSPAVPLERAILGSWHSDLASITYEFRADGTATASTPRYGAREQRWSPAGTGAIRLDDATLHGSVDGDTLSLGEPPQLLAFRRVG